MKAPGEKGEAVFADLAEFRGPVVQIWGGNSAAPFDRRLLNLLPDNEPVHL